MTERNFCQKCYDYNLVRSLCRKCDGMCPACGGHRLEGDCPKCLRKELSKKDTRIHELKEQVAALQQVIKSKATRIEELEKKPIEEEDDSPEPPWSYYYPD